MTTWVSMPQAWPLQTRRTHPDPVVTSDFLRRPDPVGPFEAASQHTYPLDAEGLPPVAELADTAIDGDAMQAGPRRVDHDVGSLAGGADQRVGHRLRGCVR